MKSQDYDEEIKEKFGDLLKEAGATVTAFTRFEVGDGIEKETVDFAEEVRAQAQGSD